MSAAFEATWGHWAAGRPRVVLLATDWTARSDRPLDRAIQLTSYWNAMLVVLTVVEAPVAEGEWVDLVAAVKARIFAEMPSRDVRFHIDVARGNVADSILAAAANNQADLIVTGIANRDHFGAFVLGTAVDRLVRQAQVPVLVVKERPRNGYARIMATTDYSECSAFALGVLPAFPRAEVTLVHARLPELGEALLGEVDDAPDPAAEVAERAAFVGRLDPATHARLRFLSVVGSPSEALGALVRDQHYDLALVDRYGHGGVGRALIGSTAERLLAALTCDVMIVPSGQCGASARSAERRP